MDIAVSGASGLIGSALLKRLDSPVTRLRLLQRPSRNDAANAAAGNIETIAWDPLVGVKQAQQLDGLDAFFHLAGRSIGQARWSNHEKTLLRSSRVEATQRLVEQIVQLKNPPKVFIGASAIGIYGDCADRWVDESSREGNDFLAELGHDWEAACQPLVTIGVRLVHARFGIVLDRHGGALGKMLPPFRWGLGGKLGSGRQYMSWISLNDCCRALLHLMHQPSLSGPFNLVSPNPVTNAQFTKQLGHVLRRPTWFAAPSFGLRLALGEMADALLLSSCRVLPRRLMESGFEFEDPNLNDALARALGCQQVAAG